MKAKYAFHLEMEDPHRTCILRVEAASLLVTESRGWSLGTCLHAAP